METWKNRVLIWLGGIIIILLLLTTTVWFGRPTYRHYKEKNNLAAAQKFLANGDFRSALLCARQTLQFDPTNVPACRIMAELASISHSPTVLDWQRRIVQAEPTVENKLALALSGLHYQTPPFPLTSQILDELTPFATNLTSYQVVAASLALSTHRVADAEADFETATRLEPTNHLYELNLAIIRLSQANETKADQSRAVLEKLQMDENLGLSALRALVVDRLTHNDMAAANDCSTQLLNNAHVTLSDRLQNLGILRQLKSEGFTARLQAVQHQSATNAFAIAEVATWMQANNLLADDINWLTNLPARMQTQQPVRLVLADGYMQSTNWLKLRDFTSKGNWDDMEFLRLALVAQAWSQLNMPQVANRNWSAAINETGNRYEALTTLLELAKRWQWKNEQKNLLQRIIEKFPQERWAQQALLQFYMADGDTAGLQQFYAKLFSVFPQDASIKNNLAATSLLLKTNLPQAYKLAEEIYAGKTNNLFVASTYAFALHRQGRTKDGLAVMQKLDDRLLEQPSAALYYGVLLAASGATNEAAPFLKIAQTKTDWLPEEQLLLFKALGEI